MAAVFFTKMKGNTPTVKLSRKLIISGTKAVSSGSVNAIMADNNIKSATTKRAYPTLRLMVLQFILWVIC